MVLINCYLKIKESKTRRTCIINLINSITVQKIVSYNVDYVTEFVYYIQSELIRKF